MNPNDPNAKDARRYLLLKNYLLRFGFVFDQRISEGQKPFVLDTDFYGYTFEEAVDSLQILDRESRKWKCCKPESPRVRKVSSS